MSISPQKSSYEMRPLTPHSSIARNDSFSGSILDDIAIEYGPADALNTLFLNADTVARSNGVRLSFATFSELIDVNKKNLDSWQPLVPIFDPDVGGITNETGFCIVARNAEGDVIATQAARLYTWLGGTNLKHEAESLRLFYADPEHSKRPGELCQISAPSAAKINGRTVFPGAVWYRPDYRKKGLHQIIGRVVKGIAFTRWYTDAMFTFMAEHTIAKGFAEASGYYQTEWDVVLRDTPWGTARLGLCWSDADQLVDYFFRESNDIQSQVDAVVHSRTADQAG